jgi:hypothetical protein
MSKRRGRNGDLSEEEVRQKIFSSVEEKPGEGWELFVEMQKLNGGLTPDVALEIADGVYYRMQPNAGKEIKINDFFYFLEANLGIDAKTAMGFSIVKYLTRLNYGDNSDYKKIEENVMAKHLESLPKIRVFAPDLRVQAGLLKMYSDCDWLWN